MFCVFARHNAAISMSMSMSLCHYVTSVIQALTRLSGIMKYPVQADDYNNDDSLQARLTAAAGELVISISRSA